TKCRNASGSLTSGRAAGSFRANRPSAPATSMGGTSSDASDAPLRPGAPRSKILGSENWAPREPSNGISVPVFRLLFARLLLFVPVAVVELLRLVGDHGIGVGLRVALLHRRPGDARHLLAETPLAVDLVVRV